MRVPGFFVFPEVVLPPARVSSSILICSGVQTGRIIVPLYKGPSQIVRHCYFDDAERVHAVLCRERGQGSRV